METINPKMKLYIVPTPIGNLKDMTYRSVEVLKEMDFVLAEDTRKTGILLKHYGISKPVEAFHKFNEHKKLENVVNKIKTGKTAALVSDAGTPGISDPGFLLVRELLASGIEVETLPGATAFVPALINSGLPCERFVFEGFLPVKKGRQKRLTELVEERRTMIFYESPHKLLKTLDDFSKTFGNDRKISISRELTKIYEENFRGTIEDAIKYFSQKKTKGEFVVVVAGKK